MILCEREKESRKEDRLMTKITDLRNRGWKWSEIGKQYNITATTAQMRYTRWLKRERKALKNGH